MRRSVPLLVAGALVAVACSGGDDAVDEQDDVATPPTTQPASTEAPDDEAGDDVDDLVDDADEPEADVVEADAPSECLPGELCVTVMGDETTGSDLRLMLYEATDDEWPQQFRSLPTPSWVVSEYPAVPDQFPLHIRMPFEEHLFAISSNPLDGARLGLAIATGAASIMTVESTDARGFSESTILWEPGAAMDFGTLTLELPAGDTCELNAYHPDCLTGDKFWQVHMLGDVDYVPGAVYLAVADVDGDGVHDLVTVGEPHFEDADRPLTDLRLGVYYLNQDLTVRESEILDEWTEDDQTFYSAWGVNVIDHGGEPVIVVGTNIPDLAPLEDGTGAVLEYRRVDGTWERTVIVENPEPRSINHNAMITVACDIDRDGDDDLALSSAFGGSAVGSWLENTGSADPAWIPHLQTIAPDTDPAVRGVLAYKCTDLDDDGYPEVAYNAMFDIPDTDPPRYRGEIWLGLNPGPEGWEQRWPKTVIDDDNWASADMWFHDFDGDGADDLIANQIFSSTVTRYWNPGGDLTAPWEQEIIISRLTSPSDMWLTDMDDDGLVDVVSADHTAHTGVWHRNPGPDAGVEWSGTTIYRDVYMPGDFTMTDVDADGDLDWVGVSMRTGQGFIVEQTAPPNGLALRLSTPDGFDEPVTQLILTLADTLPVTGMPVSILAVIANTDADGDGLDDVDQILSGERDLVMTIDDVGLTGEYHVVAALYVEDGGQFQPVPGVDYMAASDLVTFGDGPVSVELELMLAE